jgi:hypothetical protein
MSKQTFDINKLRVASPCSVSWNSMTGSDQKRFCDSCQLNVYNFAEMTAEEVRNLIAESEGRICGRLYRRTDGTVLTKDCPVGFRVYRQRVARFAGAALATVLGLFSVSFAQKTDEKPADASQIKIVRMVSQENILSGTVIDQNGGVIPNAEITLRKGTEIIVSMRSDEKGVFSIPALIAGDYSLEIKALDFKTLIVENVKIGENEKSQIDVTLNVDPVGFMGIVELPVQVHFSSDGGTTTIKREMLDKFND